MRCSVCGVGLPFDSWSRGQRRCEDCARLASLRGPAATYVPTGRYGSTLAERAAAQQQYRTNEQILDELPDSLMDELVAALEAEARGDPLLGSTPLHDVMDEIGLGRSPREWRWTTWGFAAGFAVNVGLAKYAQMSTSAPMSEFMGPLLIGGLVAGSVCAAIAWGIAKLRDPGMKQA